MKLKKGDNVIMLGGKDRSKKGKIIRIIPDADKIVVEGLNLIARHLRPRQQGQKGQILHKERLVSSSSVALICKSCGKITRIGYRLEGQTKTRICKKCKSEV